MLFLAHIAFAQSTAPITAGSPVGVLITRIMNVIVLPIIEGLAFFTFLVFVWGVVDLIRHADDPEARRTGERHVLWGVIGMFIMISAYAIVRIIATTVGVNNLPV